MGTAFRESNYYHWASMYANVLDDCASHMPRHIISDIFRDWAMALSRTSRNILNMVNRLNRGTPPNAVDTRYVGLGLGLVLGLG